MVSRLVREALSAVVSILRRNPTSLTQKKAANDKASTTKYSTVRRARIGKFMKPNGLRPSSRTHGESESISWRRRHPSFFLEGGRKPRQYFLPRHGDCPRPRPISRIATTRGPDFLTAVRATGTP